MVAEPHVTLGGSRPHDQLGRSGQRLLQDGDLGSYGRSWLPRLYGTPTLLWGKQESYASSQQQGH